MANIKLLVALATLMGCSAETTNELVEYHAGTPSYLWCGWAPSSRYDMDWVGEGQCWFVTPQEDRRLGPTDDPCAARSETLELAGGQRMHVFSRVGSKGDDSQGRLKYVIKECTASAL